MSSAVALLPGAEPFRFDGGATGVLLIHGFTGSPASMRPVGAWLAEQGISVFGPRLPGHGTSVEDLRPTRWRDWFAEVAERSAELAARCERVVVVAQSFGGALAIHLAATRPTEVAGLVLLNPYVRDRRLAVLPVARLFVRAVKGIGSDISKPGCDEVAYDRMPVPALASMAEMLRIADGELPRVDQPLLVFRSGEDHVIPKGNPARVVQRAGSGWKELVSCPNSFHVISLDRDAEMVRGRILEFIQALDRRAPRG